MFSIDWHQKFLDIVIYAAINPWTFLYTIFLCLTPLFVISGYLAFRLSKDIERNEKVKRNKTQHNTNIAKVRKHAKRQ